MAVKWRWGALGLSLTFAATLVHAVGGAKDGSPPTLQLSPIPPQPSHTSSSAGPTPAQTFARYCGSCHSPKLHTGDFSFTAAELDDVAATPEKWERAIAKLRVRAMPPVGRPRPDDATYEQLTDWLSTQLDTAAAAHPNPGRTETFHRLNRVEYRNVIRDLLALDVDVAALLPPDDTFESGFDNNASMLSISPAQVEEYLAAAKKISRLAVGVPPVKPILTTYRVPLTLVQDERIGEDQPFGSRGGTAVHHVFPVDGEYSLKIKLQSNYNDYLRGMGTKQQLDVRLDGTLVKRFNVGGEAPGKPAPVSYAGNLWGDPAWENYMHTADAGLELRFPATAGSHVVSVSFLRNGFAPEGVLQPRQTSYALAVNEMYDGNAAVDSVEIGGPYRIEGPGTSDSRRAIFTCPGTGAAADSRCARQILSHLARRAYRRPPTDADVSTLLEFFERGRTGGTFDTGIQFALERLLVDPDFLLRIERDRPGLAAGTAYPLSDLELASRLSFFLWGSIPDETLLNVAIAGKLTTPAELQRQVRRMMSDPRAKSLVDNFAAQWLNLRNLDGVLPDPDVFPDFDENLREAFRQETSLFIESTIVEDRSVLDLLSANYTFVNERLAQHYGIPGVYGNQFRRVTFPADSGRGGLLGQGALLTVTSYPNRTSPVLRGKWLLQNIFGYSVPPPPPDVPSLAEPKPGSLQTVRAALEEHRKNPACASCHANMDPLGFTLENFDAIGAHRVTDGGAPLDVTGVTASGIRIDGPAGLRALLLARPSLFATTVTEKLLAYAIGRGLDYYDQPTVREIVRASARDGYHWSSIIQGIVNSATFRMRSTAAAEAKSTAAPGNH